MDKLVSMFGDNFLTKDGLKPVAECLAGKEVIGIYFSAHWCPPCRGFTPSLAATYEAVIGAGHKFEVIFASLDRDEQTFTDYYNTMPWLALPFTSGQARTLADHFQVSGIPCLIILNADGTVRNMNGRTDVAADPTGAKYPW